MAPIPVIDSHVHFWNPGRLRYPWLAGVPALNRVWEPAEFAAASAAVPVRGLVFVECGRDPAQAVDEAAWVTELAAREPRILGVVAHAAVERGDGVRDELAALARHGLVKGVRRLLQDEAEDSFCLRPGFVDGVRHLAEFGFSFDLCIYHRQLPSVIELVTRCPRVTFVLDHAGKPAIRERRLDPWRAQMTTLAALPNVWCKLSGLVTEADHAAWQADDLRPYIEHVLAAFGPGRTMFGGDWPVATLASRYDRWFDVARAATAGLGEADQRRVFRENAARCYRLQVPETNLAPADERRRGISPPSP